MMLLQATAAPQSSLQSQFMVLLLTGIALAAAVVFYNMLPRSGGSTRRGRRRRSSSDTTSSRAMPAGAVEGASGNGAPAQSRWPYLIAAGVVLYLLLVAMLRPGFLQGLSPQPDAAPPSPAVGSPFDDPEVRRQVVDVIKTRKEHDPAPPPEEPAPPASPPPPQVAPPPR